MIPNVKAIFLPPAPSLRCLENLSLSDFSLANRTEVLSYNCPLNDRPSPAPRFTLSAGPFSVDSHRACLAAATRRQGGEGRATLVKFKRRAVEGARLVNDMVN
jgi:hypothetical protein